MKTIYYAVKAPQYAYSFPQPLDTIAFFDIETTGLSAQASSLYLIGMLRYDSAKGEWVLCQWFADDYHSEKTLIESFLTELEGITYLYHFNGRTFDIPYLFKKCARHAISLSEHCRKLLNDTSGIYSLDLLAKIRPLRSALSLKQCNQTAIERWLGIYRTDTFSGGELISVYSEYMQQRLLNAKKDTTRTGSLHSAAIPAASSTPKKAEALEKVLLLHNYEDVEMMLTICSLLTYDEYLSGTNTNRLFDEAVFASLSVELSADETALTLTLVLPFAVPKAVTLTNTFCEDMPPAALHLEETTASLFIPPYRGSLKFFFPNYKDYYYLPMEDTAIHKSVAEFVDSAFRKRATAATCYTKKEGTFLPYFPPHKKTKQPETVTPPAALFFKEYKDKLSFCELPEDYMTNLPFWKAYLQKQLPCFR